METSIEDRIAQILVKHDPIKIYFPEYNNRDEYVPEAQDIADGLSGCTSAEKCLELVYLTFIREFGLSVAGDRNRYTQIAEDIWVLRQSK